MSLYLGPRHYFAIVDDRHDVDAPLTIVRVFDECGPDLVRELTHDVVWIRTTILERIEAGEVPYRAQVINEEQAMRVRGQWERKITYRYSVLVNEDDPTDTPVSVIREWDASTGNTIHEGKYVGHGVQQWLPSNARWMSEYGRDDQRFRVVPSDADTVQRFVCAVKAGR